jgi:hypothetical protein
MELLLPCSGNCRETMIEVVPAIRYDEVAVEQADLQVQMQALTRILRRLVVQPSGIESRPAFQELQTEARDVLRGVVLSRSAPGDDREPVSPLGRLALLGVRTLRSPATMPGGVYPSQERSRPSC